MSLITKKTKDIMLNGINIFAKSLNDVPENVQILFTLNEEKKLKYYKCLKGKPVEEVTFLKILGTPFDILKYEKLAAPFLRDSVIKYATKENKNCTEIFIFISKGEQKELWVSAYTKENKIEMIPIESHFEAMGIK